MNYKYHLTQHESILQICFNYQLEGKYYYMMVGEMKMGRIIEGVELADGTLLLISYVLTGIAETVSVHTCMHIPVRNT